MAKKLKRFVLTVSGMLLMLCLTLAVVACGGLEDVQSVEISNKSALQADWAVGGADRTVEVVLTPATRTLENTEVSVSTSNAQIVSADGLKLHAVAAGTATITVSVGELTDSVKLTVKTAAVTSLTITNKTALEATWHVGDADRTVELAIEPSSFTAETAGVTLTSSNTSIVTVDGLKLHAVAVGTAKITAKAGDVEASVDVAVTAEPIEGLDAFSIANKQALEADFKLTTDDRAVEYSFTPDTFTATTAKVSLASSDPTIVSIVDGKLHAVAVGTATVTATAGILFDTVTITVTPAPLGDPIITFQEYDPEETFNAPTKNLLYAGEIASLPLVSARATDGKRLDVTITCEDANLTIGEYGQIDCTVPGEYTVKYSATDDREGGHTTEKKITVNVYRRAFAHTDNTWDVHDEQGEAAEQTFTTHKSGLQLTLFNLTPGKLYYAEYEFDWTGAGNPTNGNLVGFIQARINGDSFAQDEWMYLLSARGDGNAILRKGQWNPGYDDGPYSWQIGNYRGMNDTDMKHVKLATARDDTYFYLFVNDEYVGAVTYDEYASATTLPGFFVASLAEGNDPASPLATLSKLDFCDGAEAQAKIDELVKGKQVVGYAPAADWPAGSRDNAKTSLTEQTATDEGISFKYTKGDCDTNSGMVSPYVWFDGSFSVEWDYKNTTADNGQQARMYMEVRPYKYTDPIVQFGGDYGDNSRLLLNVPAFTDPYGPWYESEKIEDLANGAHFKLTRVLGETASYIIMEAYAQSAPEKVYRRMLVWNSDVKPMLRGSSTYDQTADLWNQPMLFLFKNQFTAGEYSNLKWSTEIGSDITEDLPTFGDVSEIYVSTVLRNGPDAGTSTVDLNGLTATSQSGFAEEFDLSSLITFRMKNEAEGCTVDAKGRLVATKAGTYSVYACVTDPTNGKTAEKEITVKVYLSVFGASKSGDVSLNDATGTDPYVTTKNGDCDCATLNVAPSKLYYGEMTVVWTGSEDPKDENKVGFGHATLDEWQDGNKGLSVVSRMSLQENGFVGFKSNSHWYWDNGDVYCAGVDTSFPGLISDHKNIKMAAARDDTYFYFFVNDKLIASASYPEAAAKDTILGLYMLKLNDDKAQLKNFAFLEGDEAQSKLDTLLGEQRIQAYVPNTDYWQNNLSLVTGYTKTDEGIGFTFNSDEKGQNHSIVSPYVFFGGDFTVEWDYAYTSGSGKMFLDIRRQNHDPIVTLGYQGGTPTIAFGKMEGDDKGSVPEGAQFENHALTEDEQGKTVHFKLTRKIEAEKDVYVLTATVNGTTYTATYEYKEADCHGTAVNFTFTNANIKGTYSKLTWHPGVDAAE